jgi:hypothetical protein
MALSRIGRSGKAALVLEEGNGSREREQDGVGEAGRTRSVPGAHLIQVTAPNVRKNAAHKENS